MRVRHLGNDARERRLAGAWRPPEDQRLQEVALDRLAQRLAGGENLLLSDHVVEGARTHSLGEWRPDPVGASFSPCDGGSSKREGVITAVFSPRR